MDGNSSVLLGMAPGCHGEHARHYIRRVQVNKNEDAGIAYKEFNPKAVTESIWSNNNTDWCISFPITVDNDAILKKDLIGIKQLEVVKTLFNNWIIPGQRDENSKIQNNVSNTVEVPADKWNEIKNWVWDNQEFVAGISFIPSTGSLDFNQPPYTEVLMPDELLKEYGDGIMFASGLIVDIIDVFGDLWKACDVVKGKGEKLFATEEDVKKFIKEYDISRIEYYEDKPTKDYLNAQKEQYCRWVNLYTQLGYSEELAEEMMDRGITPPASEIKRYLDSEMFGNIYKLAEKRDLIRRIEKFSCKYFDCNINKTINALKHMQLYHDWCSILHSNVEIDWTKVKWKKVNVNADTLAAASCNGGACEITKI